MTHLLGRSAAVIAAAATATGLGLAGPTSARVEPTVRAGVSSPSNSFEDGGTARERKGYYDARQLPRTAAPSKVRKQSPGAEVVTLRRLAGPGAIVDIDPVTGTPRNFGSLERNLTGPTGTPARAVALTYLRSHLRALGLDLPDMRTFRLRSDYVDVVGTHHLSWAQWINGIPVFGNGLRAHVAKSGRVVALQGAPVSGLARLTKARSTRPVITARQARRNAVRDVGGEVQRATARQSERGAGTLTRWSNGDRSSLVWFIAPSGARLAWSTFTHAGGDLVYSHVIGARTGSVLYRSDLVASDRGDARVYDYYPGATKGGKARVVNFLDRNWLSKKSSWLNGRNVFAWADLDDDNAVGLREKTPVPGNRKRAQFTLTAFRTNPLCSPRFVCTWDANTPFSWRTNKRADVTNGFYLANNFHDYLVRRPIGFTPAAGNFERADGDPLLLNALDGADTSRGFPDGDHVDNANMATPPDGIAPTMQMYVWHVPNAPNSQEPILPTSGSFDASIVYHEYTHGLSNRLVVDAAGNGVLNSIQAGSMGEAWSDYYAMDYLVTQGLASDSVELDGQIRVGKYVLANRSLLRTEAMDCDPDSGVAACTDLAGVKGGYTYGDFPTIGGVPEVHTSGEVWSQTLWDIRERLGHRDAAMLITRGMELSPAEPSMLDMRNAIIQADKVVNRSTHTTALWGIFAARGMGWYAGAIEGGDAAPAEDFHRPPSPLYPPAPLSGRIIDPITGEPVPRATVLVTGHPEYTAKTDAKGMYRIDDVRPGTYQKIIATGPGHELVVKKARVTSRGPGTPLNFDLRRDWVSASGGGTITDFNGPDFTPACGPGFAIDVSQGTGWGSTTGDDAGSPTNTVIPKFIAITLPQPIDIAVGSDPVFGTAFRVDPTAVCGDARSASTNEFRIEVSSDGSTWTTAVDGAFGAIDQPDTNGRYFDVPSDIDATDVQFVRFWMDSPQVPNFSVNCPAGSFSGCRFMDMTELLVFGKPATP